MKRNFFAGLAALAMSSAPMTEAADIAQQMRHWWVECDQALYCKAETSGQSNDNDFMHLRLERWAEADSPIFVTVAPEHAFFEGTRIEFDIPGVMMGISGVVSSVREGNAASFSERRESALVDSFRKGNAGVVRVFFEGELGTVDYQVSLEGVTDVLTVMDIVQQRLGRVDAAVAWGASPSGSLSDIFPDGGDEDGGDDMGATDEGGDAHMEEGPNGSFIDLLAEEGTIPDEVLMPGYRMLDCPKLSESIQNAGVLLNRDETARRTYLVPCAIGKANVSYYVVVHDPRNGLEYETMEFQLPPGMNKPNRALVLNPVWNAYDQSMTITRFGNINRNCGAYEVHYWLPEARMFELALYREKKQCGGAQVQPEDFPIAWTIEEMGD
jgi:hypothetical protein